MNTFQIIDTDYIRSSRTIETILVRNNSNNKFQKVFFIYNYEGYSFRVFDSHSKLIDFFINQKESDIHFKNEKELDFFLANVNLN